MIYWCTKPIEEKQTDAKKNLFDAFKVALSDKVHGVKVVFDGKIIDGVRAKKVKSKSYDAFESIDVIPDEIDDDEVVINENKLKIQENENGIISNSFIKRNYFFRDYFSVKEHHSKKFIEDNDKVQFSFKYDERVILIKFTPGFNYELLRSIENYYKVIILESFGMGGIPNYDNVTEENQTNYFVEEIRRIKKEKNVEFIVATQVVKEGTHLGVYAVGRNDLNLTETQSMTTEAVMAKSVWALGESMGNMTLFRELFEKRIGNDRINI